MQIWNVNNVMQVWNRLFCYFFFIIRGDPDFYHPTNSQGKCSRRVAYLPDFLMDLKRDIISTGQIEMQVFAERIELRFEGFT